jgi:hypothetical protein
VLTFHRISALFLRPRPLARGSRDRGKDGRPGHLPPVVSIAEASELRHESQHAKCGNSACAGFFALTCPPALLKHPHEVAAVIHSQPSSLEALARRMRPIQLDQVRGVPFAFTLPHLHFNRADPRPRAPWKARCFHQPKPRRTRDLHAEERSILMIAVDSFSAIHGLRTLALAPNRGSRSGRRQHLHRFSEQVLASRRNPRGFQCRPPLAALPVRRSRDRTRALITRARRSKSLEVAGAP